jgi:cytidine deaminase
MVELMNKNTPIYLSNLTRVVKETSPMGLLPYAFSGKDLTK